MNSFLKGLGVLILGAALGLFSFTVLVVSALAQFDGPSGWRPISILAMLGVVAGIAIALFAIIYFWLRPLLRRPPAP